VRRGLGAARGLIVDAHLDIAWNALARGHPFQGAPAPGYLVSRDALSEAGVGLVLATIFCLPRGRRAGTEGLSYATPREANLVAQGELGFYRSAGLELIRSRDELRAYTEGWHRGRLAAVCLMEGADPVEKPAQVGAWARSGVRIIGPAWSRTRYSGGTGAPGGLTELGVRLLRAMRRHRLILDVSHLADRAVADVFDAWRGPIMASHSNARALVPGDRQLTDATVAEIARRGGVVGISFFRKHLRGDERPATLDDGVAHVLHHARAAGGPEHVGLGTDLDGGFAGADSPLTSLAAINGLRPLLRRHFSAAQVDGIMGENWIEFLGRSLPEGKSAQA
jgi:membrane dipeptidase